MTTQFNISDFNWIVSASTIQSNQGQNLTLDASNALIRLSRNGTVSATFDTSFNFTNLPFCSQAPLNDNQLLNKAAVDKISNESTYTIDMDVFNQTFKKDTITSNISTIVKNSNITTSLDTPVNQSQVYTFGQSIPNRWVAGGQGTTNTIAYSSDGINWSGLGSSIFSSIGYGFAWNGSLWVGVGSGTNDIAYSRDGITWIGLGTGFFALSGGAGYDVAWNGTLWVAGGNGNVNTLTYSYDGINWTGLGNSIFNSNALGVAWNGNQWVAVGNANNTIAYSSNGITWTPVTNSTSIFSAGYEVAWNGNIWIAGGQGTNTLAYSSNGINWTGLGTSVFTSSGRCIAWNGNIWVAVGQGTNGIAYSTNGLNWTGLGTSIFSIGLRVAWNGIRWIATGSGNNSIAYSSNGITWNGLGTSIFTSIGVGLGFNNMRQNTITYPTNLILAVGDRLAGNTGINYSTNGTSWTSISGTLFTSGYAIGWNGRIWVAGGQGSVNTLAYSYDGLNWYGLGTTIFTQSCNGLVWGGNKWTAVGYGGGVSDNSIAYSYDGINWIGLGKTIFTGNIGARGIGYNGIRWVALGGQNAPTIGYSNDGINWTAVTGSTNIFGVYGECVAWNGVIWLAGGAWNISGANSRAYSYDGITWTGLGTTIINGTCQSIDWNGYMWVAVGSLGANTIAYSYDGIAWNGVGSTFFQTNGASGVKWCGNIWVAVGDGGNNTAYSYNGVNWLSGSSIIWPRKIGWTSNLGNTYIQQPTIAGGEGLNTLAYSPDGIFWSGLGTNIFSTRCNGTIWNGTRWLALGQGTNTIAYSTDGLNWTGLGTTVFSTAGYHAAWNGSVFVAGGEGTNIIAYSSDGISWTAATNAVAVFSLSGNVRGIAWNGVSFVAVGYNATLDMARIAYSSDGITWSQASTTPSNLPTGSRGYSIAYSNRQWLAGFVGPALTTNCLLYTSTKNGSSGWQVQGTVSTSTPPTSGIYGISYNGIRWVLVGETGSAGVLYYGLDSASPPSFTQVVTSPFSTRGTDVAWNGIRYVATGQGTNSLAYSTDGITWAGVGTTVFNTAGNGLASNPRIGFPVVDSQIVLNQNGYGLSNKLDIASSGYFNNGFTNFSMTVNPTSYS